MKNKQDSENFLINICGFYNTIAIMNSLNITDRYPLID